MSKKAKDSVPDDSEIILGILNGSKDILERVYKSYFPMILKLIVSNNGDEDEAKDIFQESIIVLYNKIKCGNFQLNSKLNTFIYSVCRRLWLKRLSQKGKYSGSLTDFSELVAVDEDLAYHLGKEKQFTQMAEALVLLGEPCKTIIIDYYINNHSMQEICDKFGYTNADNVKTQKYKCLQRLKKLFFKNLKNDRNEE